MKIRKLTTYTLLIVVSICIVLGGYVLYEHKKQRLISDKAKLLEDNTHLKAANLSIWYKDQLKDSEIISYNHIFKDYLEKAVSKKKELNSNEINDHLVSIADTHDYSNISITDKNGNLEYSLFPETSDYKLFIEDFVLESVSEKKVVSTGFHRFSTDGNVYLDIVAPVKNGNKVLGSVVVKANPNIYVYPLLNFFPVDDNTIETILFEEHDDGIKFLNKVKFIDNQPLSMSPNISNKSFTLKHAIKGKKGLFEGVDYRGVEVLSYLLPVGSTPWYISTEIDKEELLTGLVARCVFIQLAVGMLLILPAVTIILIYRARQDRIYKSLFEKQKAFSELQNQFLTILKNIDDCVVCTDMQGKIFYINRAAENILSCSSTDSYGKPLSAFFNIKDMKTGILIADPVDTVLQSGNFRNFGLLSIREDREIPVYTNGTLIRNDKDDVLGIAFLMRDLTEELSATEKLVEFEQRLSTLANNLPGVVYRCRFDPFWHKEYLSDGCFELTGYTREQLLKNENKTYTDLIHPEDRENVRKEVDKAVKNKKPYRLNYRITTAGNEVKWILDQGVVVNSRKPLSLEGFMTDITSSKQNEEQLRLQARTLNSAANGIVITDVNGDVEWVNPSFTEMTGYSFDDIKGENINILRSGVHNDEFFTNLWNTINSGSVWKGEMVNRRKDGTFYHTEQTITPVEDDNGKIEHFSAIKQDITRRKQDEAALRQSEQQFKLISENVGDIIMLLNREGEIEYCSPSGTYLLGSHDSVIEKDFFTFIHPQDRDESRKLFEQTIDTKVGNQAEFRINSVDSEERIVETNEKPIVGNEGEVSQVVVVMRDVTDKKKLEQEFLRAQRLESIGSLSSGIAHDLNNILSPILLCVDLIRLKADDDKTRELLETIEVSALRGAEIIQQILKFSRGYEDQYSQIQLKHIISDFEKIIKQTFPRAIEIKIEVEKNLWAITGEVTKIQQVLLNLCVNARDAMPDGGELKISAENIVLDNVYANIINGAKAGNYVKLSVSDTGIGIPADIQDKIFNSFFTTKENEGGTGLGLSTVSSIVRNSYGFLDVYSEEGKGSVFNVFLPAIEQEHETTEESMKTSPTGSSELILVVDDEESIREISKTVLESNGYRVMTAKDGREAVDVYKSNKKNIDLILLDLNMPKLDGWKVLEKIREIDTSQKIVVASGFIKNQEEIDRDKTSFLKKPYTTQTLLNSIHETLFEHVEIS